MSYTVCCNDVLITDGLRFHIVFCVSITGTAPFFKLVKTVACVFYVVQKTM